MYPIHWTEAFCPITLDGRLPVAFHSSDRLEVAFSVNGEACKNHTPDQGIAISHPASFKRRKHDTAGDKCNQSFR